MRHPHPLLLFLAAFIGVAAPAQDQSLDDTNTQMSFGYEFRRVIQEGLEELGVELLLPAEILSSVLWSYRLPAGHAYPPLHDALKSDGFVIYAGQGDLSREIFRIAHMGDIRSQDLGRFLESFGRAMGA